MFSLKTLTMVLPLLPALVLADPVAEPRPRQRGRQHVPPTQQRHRTGHGKYTGTNQVPGAGKSSGRGEVSLNSNDHDTTRFSKKVFYDDFNGPASTAPNPTLWKAIDGIGYPGGPANWGTWEVETYSSDPTYVKLDGEGHLLLTPLKDADTGNWTSARLETVEQGFTAAKGGAMKVEARIKAPGPSSEQALGYWPAFWMVGAGLRENPMDWPGVGEIDIMEIANGANNSGHGLHCVRPFLIHARPRAP